MPTTMNVVRINLEHADRYVHHTLGRQGPKGTLVVQDETMQNRSKIKTFNLKKK